MRGVQLQIDKPVWSERSEHHEDQWAAPHSRGERLVPALFGTACLAIDLALVLGAFMLAHWVRFIAPDDGGASLGLEHYIRIGLGVSVTTALFLALHGMYDEERPQPWPSRFRSIVSAVSTSLVVAVTLSVLLGEERFSRIWFGAGWMFAVSGLVIWRSLAHTLYTSARDVFAPTNRVLIVGANPLGQQLACELAERYQVVGFVDNGSDLDSRVTYPLIGPIAQLEQFVQAYAVSEVVIALPPSRREQAGRVIARGFRRRVNVKFLPDVPDLAGMFPRRFEVHHMGGRPYIGFAPAAKVTWLKRATDLLLAGIALALLAPLLLITALAVKLDSAGPVFYRQRRVGKDGRHFSIYKFRSMRRDADILLEELRHKNEAIGPLFKIRQDPRVTRVGRVLRRLSLDELPQLFNVLKGEMSLVGPRPPLPSEVASYEDWQHGRLRAVPGMTGLWQVSGRSEVPFHDMVRLDLHYIRNWSLGLDLEIILRTIPAVLANRGAY